MGLQWLSIPRFALLVCLLLLAGTMPASAAAGLPVPARGPALPPETAQAPPPDCAADVGFTLVPLNNPLPGCVVADGQLGAHLRTFPRHAQGTQQLPRRLPGGRLHPASAVGSHT
jgi:hypothetical protein